MISDHLVTFKDINELQIRNGTLVQVCCARACVCVSYVCVCIIFMCVCVCECCRGKFLEFYAGDVFFFCLFRFMVVRFLFNSAQRAGSFEMESHSVVRQGVVVFLLIVVTFKFVQNLSPTVHTCLHFIHLACLGSLKKQK